MKLETTKKVIDVATLNTGNTVGCLKRKTTSPPESSNRSGRARTDSGASGALTVSDNVEINTGEDCGGADHIRRECNCDGCTHQHRVLRVVVAKVRPNLEHFDREEHRVQPRPDEERAVLQERKLNRPIWRRGGTTYPKILSLSTKELRDAIIPRGAK